jgi:hypothetical protein
MDGDDLDVISPAELEASRRSMNLSELKHKPIPQLLDVAAQMGLEILHARASRTSFFRS